MKIYSRMQSSHTRVGKLYDFILSNFSISLFYYLLPLPWEMHKWIYNLGMY
jgi:hypothetical protein